MCIYVCVRARPVFPYWYKRVKTCDGDMSQLSNTFNKDTWWRQDICHFLKWNQCTDTVTLILAHIESAHIRGHWHICQALVCWLWTFGFRFIIIFHSAVVNFKLRIHYPRVKIVASFFFVLFLSLSCRFSPLIHLCGTNLQSSSSVHPVGQFSVSHSNRHPFQGICPSR